MSTPTTSKLTKVYDLQVVGSNDVYSELDKINKLLIEAKRNAKALRDELGKSFISEELKKLQDKIANLEKQQADLIKQMKEQAKAAENNAKIVTEATKQEAAKRVAASKEATDKINADSKRETETKRQQLLEQKKLSEQERTEAARKVKEMKDLQLQQKQAKATQFTAQQNAAPGSYYDIANQYRKLSQDVKSTIPLSDQAAVDAALANLTKLKEQLDNFARNLTKDKTLVGEYSTGVIQAFQKMGLGTMIADQVNTAKKSLDTLNAEFEVLRNELGHVKQTGQGSLDAIERQLVENRQAALQLTEQIDRVEQSLRGVGGFGTQLTEALGKEFKGLKQHMMEMVVGFVGIQQMIEGIRQSAHINYELSDTFSDIKNRIHGTDEEVQHLFESLKKLDTRTSLQGLTDIAAIVAKKGVAREEIAGITQAIDNLMLVLGGETGDVKETTSSLVKLVTIFSEDKHVTADNINSIGGAIAKLTTSGVATGSFLIDFAERMGGIKGVAGFTIDKILGLGASLEELGQSAEVSGTAMSQVIIKLFTDTQHYADLTGMSLSAFKQSLATDVVGTLVKVAEALKGNAGEMEHFFEGVEEMHNKGARVVGVLGDLATNGDYVRKRMQQATVALHQNNLVTDMAAEKQKNFAATVDNIKKSFEVLITSQGFRDTFNLLGEFVITLVKNLPELIKWGTALAAVWLLSQGNLLLLNLQLRGYQLLLLASRGAMVALTAAQTAYTTVIRLYTGSITLAEAATALFNRTLLANPFAAVITVVSALAAAVIGLGYAITNNTDALTDQETRLKTNLEIEKKVTESTSAQIGHIRNLIAVIKDKTASHEVQAKALEEVVKTSGDYLKGLTLENAATMEGIKLVDQYIDSLKKKAAYQAAQQVNAEKYHQDAQLQALEMSLQEKKSAGKTDIGDMTDDEKAQLGWFSRNFPHIMQLSDLATTPIDEALTKVRELREKLGNELDITNKMVQEKYKAMLGDDKYTAADAIGYTEDHAIGMRAGLQAMDKKIYWRKPTDDVSDLTKKKEESEQAKKVHDLELAIEQTKKKIKIAKRQHKEGEVMELKVELEHLRQQLKEVKGLAAPHGSRLTTEEYEKFKLINAWENNETRALNRAYKSKEATQRVYNRRIIDNERAYLEELEKIELTALQKKISKIEQETKKRHSIRPAEAQELSDLKLKKTEVADSYSKKFFKMDQDELNAQKTKAETSATNQLANVENSPEASDMQKVEAKNNYYIAMTKIYRQYMAEMDKLEKKFNAQSEKNQNDREAELQAIENNRSKTELEVQEERNNEEERQIENDFNKKMRILLENKIKKTQAIIADPDKSAAQKKEAMEKEGLEFEKHVISEEAKNIEMRIALNKQLWEAKRRSAEEYYRIYDALIKEKDSNIAKAEQLKMEEAMFQQQMVKKSLSGAIDIVQTVGSEMLAQEQRNADLQMQREQRAMDWNKKVLDSQMQSHEQQRANDVAFHLAQEQMAKKKAQEDKKRAQEQMAMEYAVAAFRIVAANLWKGPEGWAEIAIEEGILAATYGLKLAFMSNAQTFGDGGEVPGSGGEFGGKPHGAGGTPFIFRGRQFEAEAGELAIINKRSSSNTGMFTFSGTPKQIASGLNALGGGVNFAPGWSGGQLPTFDYGGMLGADLRMPDMIFRHALAKEAGNGGNSGMEEIKASIAILTGNIAAMTSHVQTIQVQLDPHGLNSYNYNHQKAVHIGKI